ncbi:hypothetical protein CHUAL_005543 [Chamberlinius hualienensis]
MDLCGIKWRRLCTDNIYGVDPLDDPVLLAYSKCLAADILCVWRKVPQQRSTNSLTVEPQHHRFLDTVSSAPPPLPPSQPPLFLKKELWIFWYGEEPDLNNILYPELSEQEQGSWENGLSYECRTLLFAAIHNRIERSFLSKDYVRLGKWFVQPYDNPGKPIRNPHSIAFSFFIHGESTVCACLDVREPPPVRRLTHQHLQNAQRLQSGTPVILCPYGQAGTLSGQASKDCDPLSQKLLEDWQKYYPLDSKLGSCNNHESSNELAKMPNFVEVIVGGFKLKYPSCYVLVCDLDEPVSFTSCSHNTSVSKTSGMNNVISSSSLTPPTSPVDPGLNISSNKGSSAKGYSFGIDGNTGSCEHRSRTCWEKPSRRVVANARQDSTIFPGLRVPLIGTAEESNVDTSWEFGDPGQKLPCSCVRGRKSRQGGAVSNRIGSGHSSGSGLGSSQGKKGDKSEKGEKQPLRHARSSIPFHRRSPVNDEVTIFDGDAVVRLSNSFPIKGSGLSPGNLNNVPQLRTNALEPPASVGSPASAAPSPLVGSMRPPSVAANDSFLTSPSPLTASAAMSVSSTSVDMDIVKTENLLISESHDSQLNVPNHTPQDPPIKEEPKLPAEQAASPFPNPTPENAKQSGTAPTEGTNWPTGAPTNQIVPSQAATTTVAPQRTVQEPPVQLPRKRPTLPMSNYEELIDDEPQTASLYDYSSLQAWLQHPVKKFKPDIKLELTIPDQSVSGCCDSTNLPSPIVTTFKKEPLSPQPSLDIDMTSPKPTDPYEFVDDFPTTVSMAGFKSKNEPNKDDEKPRDGMVPGGPSPADSQVTTAPPTPVSVNQPPTPGGTVSREVKTSVSLDPLGSPPTPKTQSKDPVSLLREKDLIVTINDLDQLFDTSDDSNDDAFQAPSPPGSIKAISALGEDGTSGKSSKSAGCIGILGPTELSRMFPTPPSLEQASPCGPVGGGDTGTSDTGEGVFSSRERSEAYTGLDSPQESVMDWSYVYKPQMAAKFVSSTKYAPLSNLPSQTLPPVALPSQCIYKPSWQYPMQVIEKPLTLSRIGGLPSVESVDRMQGSVYRSMEPSPATFVGSVEPRMPLSFELQSPASNASSYLNKNVNSVDDTVAVGSSNCVVGGTMGHVPETHSLFVCLVLSDSVLNLFKDHNFNSCTMCVCHMNIKGADVGLYLPDTIGPNEEPPSNKCTCGFSAVVNRNFAHQAGLFYEDEVEITGLRNEVLEHRKPSLLVSDHGLNSCNPSHKEILDPMPPAVLDLLLKQYATLSSSSACTLFYKTNLTYRQMAYQTSKPSYIPHPPPHNPVASIMATISAVASGCSSDSSPPSTLVKFPNALDLNTFNNALEILDACEVAFQALELGRTLYDNLMCLKLDENLKYNVLHKWPFLSSNISSNNGDLVRLLKVLQPMLQDAIHRKQSTQFWEATTTATYNVSGPLTWREFLKLAGRSIEDQCEPQPIPSVLVGCDKEWLATSPFAIKYWEKLLLEPYNNTRDIAYIVVAPDNDFVLENVKTFFKELSCIYEVCKLGRHSPISKVLRDGVMRVGRAAATKLADQPVDDWFNLIGDSSVALKLKLYAQVCRYHLASHLSTQPMDSTLLDQPQPMSKPPEKVAPAASPMPPSTPDNQEKDRVSTPKPEPAEAGEGLTSSTNKDTTTPGAPNNTQDSHDQDDDHQTPAVVIYMVDPFTYNNDSPAMHRLASIGLMRCYAQMLRFLPENMQNNVQLQIIPLESILEQTTEEDRSKHTAKLKSLAFAVYSQCRRTLAHQSTVKSLTGFGPAAAAEKFLKSKDERNAAPYRIYSPPYILAPVKDKQTQLTESFGEHKEKATVLFCTYCLSEDQRWLLATCTDDRGEFLETCVINIDIPNRYRRKKASARKTGLSKLMEWLLGVMSQAVLPWRLVIGRFGRLGHGELRGWSNLLSRKSLLRYSKYLRESCKQCSYLGVQETPCILSACLVSLEADSALRVMADQFATPDEHYGSSSNSCDLSTPQDASCTHILVFPTSATTQSSQATFQQDTIDLGANFQEEDILSALDEEGHNMSDINDLFSWTETASVQSPEDSPRRNGNSRTGSPGLGISGGRQSPFQNGGFGGGGDDASADPQEEAPQLLQQPLALGYYVSTAKTGPLPKWFWTSGGHLENVCPAFLKSALHVHSPSITQNQDDLFQQHLHSYHPLDSNLTTDVLRCVLEGYNALSWLVMDPITHDRRSCLPLHIQVLMQMYYSMAAIV